MTAIYKFIQQIQNNEITDYTPYLTAKPASIQVCMAQYGILVPELCEQKNPIVLAALIRSGFAKEKYAEWKQETALVRRTLAGNGYFHSELIHDRDYKVRLAVVEANPAYAEHLLTTKSKKEYDALIQWYGTLVSVSFSDLEKLMAHPFFEQYEHNTKAPIRAKYATRTIQMTAIEKTMTFEQLIRSDSDAWKHMFTGKQLSIIRWYEKTIRNHQDGFKLLYDYMKGKVDDRGFRRYAEYMYDTPTYRYKN